MPNPGEGSTCRKCRKDIVWIDDRAWTAIAGESGTWCVDESSHEPVESVQKPHPRQAAVIEAVCGLANALMGEKGRGWGQTWTRERIAARVLADDGAGSALPLELTEIYQGTALAEAETTSAAVGPVAPPAPADSVHLRNQVRIGDPVGYEVQLLWNPGTANEHWRTDTDFIVSATRAMSVDDVLERALSYIEDSVANMVSRDQIRLVAVCSVEEIS